MNRRLLNNGYLVFLGMLLCTDFVFIVLHLVHTYTPYIPSGIYSIEQDKGHAEVFQYTKLFWIAILLTVAVIKEASLTNFSWLLLFGYVLFDDALSLHENLGLAASNLLAFSGGLGLRPRDWGELLVTGIIGCLLLLPIALAYVRGSAAERAYTRTLGLLLVLLALFGVGIDMLHSLTGVDLWGLVEDGGEMLVVSGVLYYIFRHCFDPALAGASAHEPATRAQPAYAGSATTAGAATDSELAPVMASASIRRSA